MLEISNVRVYDLKESIIASRNAMRLTPPEYTDEEFEKSLPRAIQLANTKNGSGHQTFLSGIRVSFDLKYPNYISPELQRYHWIDIVTSSSKMHRLTKMDMDACFNEYVTQNSINQMKQLIKQYNYDPTYERFMYVISNCPQGVELFMRVSTNYLQLKTIYHQRKTHKLKEDWGNFCKAIRVLPYAQELIVGLNESEYEQTTKD
ncbi:MAG: hypothetical protein II304_00295 [Bacteroidales bacterium]|nr:hypothetical protein [Bacteroidales bacterium]